MLVVRYVAVLALTVWVGGVVALGAIAAPSAFDVLAGSAGSGRAIAGAVVLEMLRRFHLVSYACGALVLLSLLTRVVLGPRPRRFALRFATAALMLGASVYGSSILSAHVGAQPPIGGVASSAGVDAGRPPHDGLNGAFTSVELFPLAAGLFLLFWELRD